MGNCCPGCRKLGNVGKGRQMGALKGRETNVGDAAWAGGMSKSGNCWERVPSLENC